MHKHHTIWEMVFAPGPKTQVPAIVYGSSTLLGVLPPGLNSKVTQCPLAGSGVGMGNIGNFIYDNCHQKYHGYCKYHDIM